LSYNKLKETEGGYILYNTYDQYVGKSVEVYGDYQLEETKFFDKYVQEGDFVLEVGANIGTHTVWFSKKVGDSGFVLAFEPQRLIFQTLCGNIALNSLKNVDCKQLGVGLRREIVKVPFLDPEVENNFGGLSIKDQEEGEDVAIINIDGMRLDRLDFLKIDVEGMEPEVLMGGLNTINKFKPIIYMEVDREENHQLLSEIVEALDYSIEQHNPFLYSDDYEGDNIFPNVASFNALCIPRNRAWPQ
jgi:FkbM family methyltransferase